MSAPGHPDDIRHAQALEVFPLYLVQDPDADRGVLWDHLLACDECREGALLRGTAWFCAAHAWEMAPMDDITTFNSLPRVYPCSACEEDDTEACDEEHLPNENNSRFTAA